MEPKILAALFVAGIGIVATAVLQARKARIEKGMLHEYFSRLSEHFGADIWYSPPDDLLFSRKRSHMVSSKEAPGPRTPSPTDATVIMQIVVSLIVLIAALYVVVVEHDAETSVKDWAFSIIGLIVGFWLRESIR